MMKFKAILVFAFVFIISGVTFASDNITASASAAIATFSEPLTASFTVNQLFDRMEKKSENINAIISEVELSDSLGTSSVTLRVKSPDKFSITFADGSSSVFFNGSKLWIYIGSVNEVFYHFSEPSPWLNNIGSFFCWFEPKKLIIDMTRGTLNTLFDMKPIGMSKSEDGSSMYLIKLTPRMGDVFKNIFEIGYYEATFSEKNYLPVKVIEFGTDGKSKNSLFVKDYRMNEEVADEYFEYKNTTNAKMSHISDVIIQKINDYKEEALEKINEASEAMKNRFLNWGL